MNSYNDKLRRIGQKALASLTKQLSKYDTESILAMEETCKRAENLRSMKDDDLMAEQIMQCKEAFSAFDKYGRGAIPVKDLKDVMRYLGLNPTENDIISIMAELDLDSTSKIKLNDFIQVVLEQMREMDTEEEIRKVFKVFDKDNNGLLNAAELKYMMTNMGHKFDDEEVDELLREADVNCDGHLNYEEFVQMLLG